MYLCIRMHVYDKRSEQKIVLFPREIQQMQGRHCIRSSNFLILHKVFLLNSQYYCVCISVIIEQITPGCFVKCSNSFDFFNFNSSLLFSHPLFVFYKHLTCTIFCVEEFTYTMYALCHARWFIRCRMLKWNCETLMVMLKSYFHTIIFKFKPLQALDGRLLVNIGYCNQAATIWNILQL